MSPSDPPARGLRLVDAMPRPLLVVFAAGVAAALALVAYGLLSAPSDSLALEDRRPAPRAPFSHDVGRISPAPEPTVQASLPPPCDAVATTRIVGGGDAVTRFTSALAQICTLTKGGVVPELTGALAGLEGATLRFGGFDRTGVESTADFSTRTIWVNIRMANRRVPAQQIAPVLLHEARHLSLPDAAVTASEELAARRVEAAACRQLVPVDDWPRACEDARDLTGIPLARAIELLVRAGYAP